MTDRLLRLVGILELRNEPTTLRALIAELEASKPPMARFPMASHRAGRTAVARELAALVADGRLMKDDRGSYRLAVLAVSW